MLQIQTSVPAAEEVLLFHLDSSPQSQHTLYDFRPPPFKPTPMARFTLFASLLFVSVSTFATAFRHGVPSNDPSLFVPNRYIVEVDGSSSALSKRGLSAVKVNTCFFPLSLLLPSLKN